MTVSHVSHEVTLVPTGTANLASVRAGFLRLGCTVSLAASAADVASASAVVLPGVGAFGVAMAQMRALGVLEALTERIQSGRGTLAICLGLQLLCEASEESPGVAGLGILPVAVKRFPAGLAVPQMGWNEVVPAGDSGLLGKGYGYFANSYYLPAAADGWSTAIACHGVEYVAAVERGAVLACQFHPELSGDWGSGILQRWLAAAAVVPC